MVDVCGAVTGKSRLDTQKWAFNMLNGNEAGEFAGLIGEKVSGVPSFSGPTWVLTYKECLALMRFLPRKSLRGYFEFIEHQFTRLRAGDQTLHAEIDRQAASGGLEANLARSSLGLPTGAVITEDPEERALKRRRLVAETAELEARVQQRQMENVKLQMENVTLIKETFATVFDKPDDRDRIMQNDMLSNHAYCIGCPSSGGTTLLQNGEPGTGPRQITVHDLIVEAGVKPSPSLLTTLGKVLSKAYRQRYNEAPPKSTRYVDGAQRDVNCYFVKDKAWLLKSVTEFLHGGSESE